MTQFYICTGLDRVSEGVNMSPGHRGVLCRRPEATIARHQISSPDVESLPSKVPGVSHRKQHKAQRQYFMFKVLKNTDLNFTGKNLTFLL